MYQERRCASRSFQPTDEQLSERNSRCVRHQENVEYTHRPSYIRLRGDSQQGFHESIAKMLGHTGIRTTKIYARLMDRTVSEEMNILRQKFSV